jgi:hypothetical protein
MMHPSRVQGSLMLALLGWAGCASRQGSVRGEDMSAEQHRQEAAKISARANAEAQAADGPPPNLAINPGGDPQAYYSPVNNASNEAAVRAERLSRHAQQHLAAAAGLEAFEEESCRGIPRPQRSACPFLGPVASIDDIEDGVRIRFTRSARVDGIAAGMRCHLAYARAHGFQDVASCPLYVRGVEVSRPAEPDTVDLVSKDTKVVAEIRTRAREEAVVARDRAH